MIKYFLAVFFVAILAGGIWFYRLPGPDQLELADRWYPGGGFSGSIKTGVSYGSAETESDPRQSLDIYRPATAGPHPVLIFFHGGSWKDGGRPGYAFFGRNLANKGFVTVIADYRKSPAHRFPAFVEDAAKAIAWVHDHAGEYGGDPGKLFLSGHSAGAHIAMLATLDRQWLGREGKDTAIIKGMIGLAGPYDFLPFTTDAARDALGKWPRDFETQPITYARGDAAPLLLLTGDADTTVKPRNSQRLDSAVRGAGGYSLLREYPGVNHEGIIMAVAGPFRGKAPVVDDIAAFIRAKSRD